MLVFRVTVIVLALSLLGVVSAQEKQDDKKPTKKVDDKDPPITTKGSLPANFKKLGLRDDQIQKIYKIRGDSKAKQDALRRQIDKAKADEKDAIEKILTPEQLKRLREIRGGDKGTDK